jgi:tetratricopeptide (TPR) repeat protein
MTSRLEMLDKLIARGSNDPFVYYARGMELRGAGRSDDALAAFEQVTERFPNYVPTYLMAGQLAAEAGAFERAREFLSKGIAAAKAAGDDHALSELSAALTTVPAADSSEGPD